MARILTTCRLCGDVEVTLDDISVQAWRDTDRGEYTMRCPVCTTITVWPAAPAVIDLLAASGATVNTVPGAGDHPAPTGRRWGRTPRRHLRRR